MIRYLKLWIPYRKNFSFSRFSFATRFEVKSYIKDTNDSLKKLCSLTNLPNDIISCFVHVVVLSPNIPHGKNLSALQKRLQPSREKKVSTLTLVELAEAVLKNNVFTFGKETFETINRNSNRN